MKRYLSIVFLYAFSAIFLSTNLSAAGWHCAVATGPADSGRYAVGQAPQDWQSRQEAVTSTLALCAQSAEADGLKSNCRVLGCWYRTIGDPFCSVVSAHHYHVPACQ